MLQSYYDVSFPDDVEHERTNRYIILARLGDEIKRSTNDCQQKYTQEEKSIRKDTDREVDKFLKSARIQVTFNAENDRKM